MGKKILSILGLGIVLIGIVFGGNLVLILVGAILLGLGQVSKENGNNSKNKQVFHEFFDDVNIDPVSHLLDVLDTNIPLPKHDYCSGSGYVQGKYKQEQENGYKANISILFCFCSHFYIFLLLFVVVICKMHFSNCTHGINSVYRILQGHAFF